MDNKNKNHHLDHNFDSNNEGVQQGSSYAYDERSADVNHADRDLHNGAPAAPQYNENRDGMGRNGMEQRGDNHLGHDGHGMGHDHLAHTEGTSAASTSKVLGIVALVLSILMMLFWIGEIIPLVLGFIGLAKAKKAQRLGVKASGGKIMNILAIVLSIIGLLGGLALSIWLFNDPEFQNQLHLNM